MPGARSSSRPRSRNIRCSSRVGYSPGVRPSYRDLRQLTVDLLREFRAAYDNKKPGDTNKDGALSAYKNFERLRSFYDFFSTGNGLRKSAVADWQRAVRRIFEIADLREIRTSSGTRSRQICSLAASRSRMCRCYPATSRSGSPRRTYSHWIQLENGLTLTGVRCDNTDRDRFRAGRNHSSSPRPDDPWANYVIR